jgi:hypothetical protein
MLARAVEAAGRPPRREPRTCAETKPSLAIAGRQHPSVTDGSSPGSVFQDVEDALVAFSHEQASRDALERAVRANQRAADLARNLYAQELTGFLTVLVAEESLFTSQDTLAQTRRDVVLQLVALYKAVGGGWEATAQTGLRRWAG